MISNKAGCRESARQEHVKGGKETTVCHGDTDCLTLVQASSRIEANGFILRCDAVHTQHSRGDKRVKKYS